MFKMVTIGPKNRMSRLPMGKVQEYTAQRIDLAELGVLGRQIYKFNIKTKTLAKATPANGNVEEAQYQRAFVVNGQPAFKRYTLKDVIVYKLARILRKIFG